MYKLESLDTSQDYMRLLDDFGIDRCDAQVKGPGWIELSLPFLREGLKDRIWELKPCGIRLDIRVSSVLEKKYIFHYQ